MQEPKHGLNEIRPYTKGDLGRVWETLSEEDYRELSEGDMTDPHKLEFDLMLCGSRMRTWLTGDEVSAVYGTTPTGNPAFGLIWALPGKPARRNWRWIVRHTQEAIQEVSQGYSVIGNWKSAQNTTQVKWLRKIGFTFINKSKLSPEGGDYYEFLRILQ